MSSTLISCFKDLPDHELKLLVVLVKGFHFHMIFSKLFFFKQNDVKIDGDLTNKSHLAKKVFPVLFVISFLYKFVYAVF